MVGRRIKLKKMAGSLGLLPPPPPPPPGPYEGERRFPFNLASVLDFGAPLDGQAYDAAVAAARAECERDLTAKGLWLHPDARPSPYFPTHDSCERYCMAQQAALIAAGQADIDRTPPRTADAPTTQSEPEQRPAPQPFPPINNLWRR